MKIVWRGWRGMRWEQLKGRLNNSLWQFNFVDLVIIHAEGNNLTVGKTPSLIETMRKDLEELLGNSKIGKVAWSDIIQRGEWRGALFPKGVEKARTKQKHLFRSDRVHLSEECLELFLGNIRIFVEEWWRSCNK
ncbi:hypothetical protein XELAEV_18006086mg [Xenopus laevis]|uniref:Uncharacterized protein n=1 Tax=Xenopus laevis TaxID=8355 RepID=A0A974DZJ0_XENLA|nr:hypothetical protein XELAEV_18006086mg [Xenopus laevis]